MMYEFLSFIFSPLITIYFYFYKAIFAITGAIDISIILMSLINFLLLIPIVKIATTYEQRAYIKLNTVSKDIENIPKDLKGEERFDQIEKIYNYHSYHPIESIKLGLSLIITLPFLLSAFLFFQNNLILFESYSILGFNFTKPDSILFNVNLLPLLIFIINLADAYLRFGEQKSSRNRYLIIASVICVLIYNMPLCLTLYWASSSIFSLVSSFSIQRVKQ